MKNKILILFCFLFSMICLGQKKITWDDLAKVTFTEKYFKEYDEWVLYPAFSPSVQALNGQEISITGYFLDIAPPESQIYILSKNPMATCFFCGGGGPETTIELQLKNKQNFKTDDMITVSGTLKLNKDDMEHFNYILVDCKATLATVAQAIIITKHTIKTAPRAVCEFNKVLVL